MTVHGYKSEDIGISDWGIQHGAAGAPPGQDNYSLLSEYRRNGMSGGSNIILASRILGMQSLWDHDPLFDYMDRHMDIWTGTDRCFGPYTNWASDVWDEYRGSY